MCWTGIDRKTVISLSTCIIIGAKKDEQLKQNLAVVDIDLSNDEKAVLEEASQLLPEYPGWMFQLQASDRHPDAKMMA